MELFEAFPDPKKEDADTADSATQRDATSENAHEAVVRVLIRTSQISGENIGIAFQAQSHLLQILGARLKLYTTPIGSSVQMEF